MPSDNYYDVTNWKTGDPYTDIGEVINSIIADIKSRQTDRDVNEGGKPGAVIYIPPGDFHLLTQVVIDISYLKITGSGHGFTSSSIRYNTKQSELADWNELWPGGSRVLVDLSVSAVDDEESKGAAFYITRKGVPRISSVEFSGFCIDGLHFHDDNSVNEDPENSYRNGRTGIYVGSANDSFVVTRMGMVYLEHGLVVYDGDALTADNNFIAECGNCVELRGMGQASKITNNLIGAGYKGYSIYAENYGGILITANNVFPRGASSVHLMGVVRSSVTGNRFHSFYPGMLILENESSENLISSNHFLRDHEPWTPMQPYDNGLEDSFGLLSISGSRNSIIGNHISETINTDYLKPAKVTPIILRIVAGTGNYVASNHIVATTEVLEAEEQPNSGCFEAQVGALLSTKGLKELEVVAVHVDKKSYRNTILDSGMEQQVVMNKEMNAFRATPTPGL